MMLTSQREGRKISIISFSCLPVNKVSLLTAAIVAVCHFGTSEGISIRSYFLC